MDLNKKLVTKHAILQQITDVDIYRYYLKDELNIGGRKILSPLRKEEDPSFGFFFGKSGEVCFNDFVLGGGDCFRFVELKFGLSFFEALSKVALDFEIDDQFIIKKVEKTKNDYNPNDFADREKLLSKTNNFELGKNARKWTAHDYVFWLQFGIDAETLKKYNVEPIQYLFINGRPIPTDKYAYAFTERKDKRETYKIYQPFSKKYKWLNNHNNSIWQGWSQLPQIGQKLIITKSLKDVMTIDALTGIPAVSLQSESTYPKNNVIKELKERFKQIYIFYDNDYDKEVNWGQQFAEELSMMYFIPSISIDAAYKSKDISDFVKHHGAEQAVDILKILLKERQVPF